MGCKNIGIRTSKFVAKAKFLCLMEKFKKWGNYLLLTSYNSMLKMYFIYVQYHFPQDPMKRPTFETLQWKLEDFFTMSDSEYKEASAY